MRYALISDIHANLPALDAVLEHIGGQPVVDASFHLGDLVGYAPWPNETVARLRAEGIPGVGGNYDSTVAAGYAHCGCQYEDPREEELSHVSYAWTQGHVSAETKAYLGALPFRLDLRPLGGHTGGPTLILVHGAPTLNTLYWTDGRPERFCRQMVQLAGAHAGDVIAVGHTHKPWLKTADGVHLVNTGSVGRPKDGDWRACYVLLDIGADGVSVEFVRVAYDVDRAMDAIRRSELPDEFAESLRTGGRLPSAVADRARGDG